jgi:hypothetical protein
MRASPSLYEGAFRLETTARPSDMFAAAAGGAAMHLGTPLKHPDDSIAEDDDDSLSSPPINDESYKIRIGPTTTTMGDSGHRHLHHRGGSLSPPPRSLEGEEEEEEEEEETAERGHPSHLPHVGGGGIAQDLSVTSSAAAAAVASDAQPSGGEPMDEDAAERRSTERAHYGFHSEESNS